MRKNTFTSSSRMLKHVASTAVIAAMITPIGAKVAYANEHEEGKLFDGERASSADIETSKSKTRQEALNTYDESTSDLKFKQAVLDAEKLKLDSAYDRYLAASDALDDASDVAQASIANAQARAQDELTRAANDVQNAQNLKVQKESELKQKATLLSHAQAQLKEANEAAIQAEQHIKDEGLNLDEYKSSQEKVSLAQTNVDEAKSNLESVQKTYQAAKEAFSGASAQRDDAYKQVSASKKALQNAQKANDEAQNTYNKTKTAYDQCLTQNNIQSIAKLRNQLNAAKANLDKASSSLASEKDAYTQSLNTYKKVQASLKSAECKKSDMMKQIEDAKTALSKAQGQLRKTQDALSSATSQYKQAQATYNAQQMKVKDLNENIKTLQKDVSRLKSEVEQAQMIYDRAKARVEAHQNDSKDLEDGAFSFFKYLSNLGNKDAKQALSILENSNLHDFVQRGNSLSATSYNNMLHALDLIDEGNLIRQAPTNNLKPLKVSHSLMAVAMVNADWATHNIKHSLQHFNAYYNGENAAWGLQDPYKGWYQDEKDYYDAAVANHEFDPSNYESFLKWGELPSKDSKSHKKQKTNHERVGHYITLVEKGQFKHKDGIYRPIRFVSTGFGYSMLPIDRSLGHFAPMTYIQDFASEYIVQGEGYASKSINNSEIEPMELYTTDQYRRLLHEWHDVHTGAHSENLTGLQKALQDKSAQYKKSNAQLNKQKVDYSGQLKSLKGAQEKLKSLKDTADSAQKTYQSLQASIATKQKHVADLNRNLVEIQTNAEAAKGRCDAVKKDLQSKHVKLQAAENELGAKKSAFTNATEKLEDQKGLHENYLDNYNKLESKLKQSKKDALAASEKVADLEDSVSQAQMRLNQLEAYVANANNKLKSSRQSYEMAQASYNQALDQLDAVESSHNALEHKFIELQKSHDMQNKAQKTLKRAQADYLRAEDELNGATQGIEDVQHKLSVRKTDSEKVAQIVFRGVKTLLTGFDFIDMNVENFKQAHKRFEEAKTTYKSVTSAYQKAQDDYKDALSKYIQAKLELDQYNLNVLSGAHQKVNRGDTFSFRIEGDPDALKEVMVDNKVVAHPNYAVSSGSTVVSFTSTFSKNLKDGMHTFDAIYDNGAIAHASFAVVYKEAEASHVDMHNIAEHKQVERKAQSHTPATSDVSYTAALASILAGTLALVLGRWENHNK